MKRFLIFLLLFVSLGFAEDPDSPTEWAKMEKAGMDEISAALASKSPGEKIDRLTDLLVLHGAAADASESPEFDAASQRIMLKAKTELGEIPGVLDRQEQRIMDAFRELRIARTEEERAQADRALSRASAGFSTVCVTFRPPTMIASIRRILEERRKFTPTGGDLPYNGHFRRAIYGSLFYNIGTISLHDFGKFEADDWDKLFALADKASGTFEIEGDPNEYTMDGRIAASPQPVSAQRRKDSDLPVSASPSRTPWIVAIIAILAAAGAFFFSKGRKAV